MEGCQARLYEVVFTKKKNAKRKVSCFWQGCDGKFSAEKVFPFVCSDGEMDSSKWI